MGSPHSGVKWATEARVICACRSQACTSVQITCAFRCSSYIATNADSNFQLYKKVITIKFVGKYVRPSGGTKRGSGNRHRRCSACNSKKNQ